MAGLSDLAKSKKSLILRCNLMAQLLRANGIMNTRLNMIPPYAGDANKVKQIKSSL
jgi:hypothetical protein